MDNVFVYVSVGLLIMVSTCYTESRFNNNDYGDPTRKDHLPRKIRKRGLNKVVGAATFEGLNAYRKLIRGAKFKETQQGSKIYEKGNGYTEALKDFKSLHLTDVRKHPLGEGFVGRVGDKIIQVKEKTEMVQYSYISIMDTKGRYPETIILYPDYLH